MVWDLEDVEEADSGRMGGDIDDGLGRGLLLRLLWPPETEEVGVTASKAEPRPGRL